MPAPAYDRPGHTGCPRPRHANPATIKKISVGMPRGSVNAYLLDVQQTAGRPGPRRNRAGYGYSRYSIRGNGIASRKWSRRQIQARVRSMPMPKPAWTTDP